MSAAQAKKLVAITRHENSLVTICDYAQDLNLEFMGIVMDAGKQTVDQVNGALLQVEEEAPTADAVIIATKIYNSDPEVSELSDFMTMMKAFYYIQNETTVIYTNLGTFSEKEKDKLSQIHARSVFVENDNISKNGMDNLNAPIRAALKLEA